jgi:hypothetical protein
MKRLICMCVAVILMVPITAFAMTGKDLKEASDMGEKDPQLYAEGFFQGYVLGAVDAAAEAVPNLCVPASVTNKQTIDVVRKYLKEHPEELSSRGPVVVLKAILAAWPCKQPQKGPKP